MQAAIDRGIHFEITYAPALREPTMRRNTFANAQALTRATRGKNIVISSAARNCMEVRGPHEAMNLGTLFGLTEKLAKAAIEKNPADAIAHGAARRAFAGAVQITIAPQGRPQQQQQQQQQHKQQAKSALGQAGAAAAPPNSASPSAAEGRSLFQQNQQSSGSKRKR